MTNTHHTVPNANIYLPRCEIIFYYQTNNCCKPRKIHRKKKMRHGGRFFFNSCISNRNNKREKSNSWQVNLGVQKVIYTHLHFSCQHCPLISSPFVKWPIFKVATQEKLLHHCTRVLRAQYPLREGVVSKVLWF